MRKRRAWLLGIAVCILILATGFAGVIYHHYSQFTQTPLAIEPAGTIIDIPSGKGFKQIIALLQEQDLSEAPLPFWQWLAHREQVGNSLKAGEYLLLPDMVPRDVLALLQSGKVRQYPFTLVDGWNITTLRQKLGEAEKLQHTTDDLDATALAQAIGLDAGISLEGQFLPETYHYRKGDTDLSVLQRAATAMQETLEQEWMQRADGLPFDQAYDALILASIVEKETARSEERARIAGVFVRRLQKDMLLQTDPTVIYGMGDNYQGIITRQALREDTPYNTYVHKGLPPTPIAMPGRASLHAVLHPAQDDALFFVARGDGSGRHVFSATLKDHNRAVKCYRTPNCSHD